MVYYNEFDTHAAAWLRELIKAGLIADGVVDERSITDVKPDELSGYAQCHFFAGIGGWSLALRLAGWPDDQPVWTGSCPCQPFSVGSTDAKGFQDPRDLWPAWFKLIKECRPSVCFGEQVASAIHHGWLDRLIGDMAGEAYACGSAVLPARAYGADHKRNRLFWVAHAGSEGWEGLEQEQRIPSLPPTPLAVYGDPLADARRALGGSRDGLLLGDGLSLQVARNAIKGFGNAIVPQVAATFIRAYVESLYSPLTAPQPSC